MGSKFGKTTLIVFGLALATWVSTATAGALRGESSAARGGYPPLTASGSVKSPCRASMRGIGIPLDQHPDRRRGDLGVFVFTPDFRDLKRYRHRLLRNKAPIAVTGDVPVTVTVPKRARHRVALSYGGVGGRHAEFEFQPCAHKRRTVWAGGLLLRDRAPVTLLVTVGDRAPLPLRLGR